MWHSARGFGRDLRTFVSGAQVRYRSWEIAHSMPPIDVAEHEREQQAPQARNAATGHAAAW